MVVPGCPDCASLNPITDPLVAAVLHNRLHIPIGRLPENLILCIMDYLRHDMHAGFCLGKVSRQFRRLVIRPIRGNYTLGWNNGHEVEIGGMQVDYGILKILHAKVYREILSAIRRDQLCNTCLALSVPNNTASMAAPLLCRRLCKFNLWGTPEIRCAGCESFHPRRAFSGRGLARQICIGREGFTRVCQHKKLSWSRIEAIMAQATADANGNVRYKECYEHPSHRGCPASKPPHFEFGYEGRPGQRIAHRLSSPIYLHIWWESHSQVSEANLDCRGRLRAPFLRSLFRDTAIVRQPPMGTESHMGMSCFSHRLCRCIHYETGNDLEALEDTNNLGFRYCLGNLPYIHRASNKRLCDEAMLMRLCAQRSSKTQDQCIVTTYHRKILIFEKGGQVAPTNPTHEWLHALDTESLGPVPGCRNPKCGDYFRSYQVLQCPEPPKNPNNLQQSNSSALPD